VTQNRPAEHVCLFGPTGAGKTTLAKYTLGQLAAATFDFRWGYANCMTDNSRGALLHRLVDTARLGRDLRREGTHTSTFLDRIRDFDGQAITVVDEVVSCPSRGCCSRSWRYPTVR